MAKHTREIVTIGDSVSIPLRLYPQVVVLAPNSGIPICGFSFGGLVCVLAPGHPGVCNTISADGSADLEPAKPIDVPPEPRDTRRSKR